MREHDFQEQAIPNCKQLTLFCSCQIIHPVTLYGGEHFVTPSLRVLQQTKTLICFVELLCSAEAFSSVGKEIY